MTTTTHTPPASAAAVKLGFWNCCQARPAYALAFDAEDGSTVWYWACSSCTHGSFGQDAAAKMAASDRVIAKADLDTTTATTEETP